MRATTRDAASQRTLAWRQATVFLLSAVSLLAQRAADSAELKPATLDDPRAAPIGAEAPVFGVPPALRSTPGSVRLRALLEPLCSLREDGRLAFRPAPDKTPTILTRSSPKVVKAEGDPSPLPIMLYCKGEEWYACSASLLKANVRKELIEFLDADLDGSFVGPADFVRHNGCAFRPVDGERLLLLNDALGHYEVREVAGKLRVSIQPLPLPEWATTEQRFGMGVIAHSRQIGGLPPWQLDQERSSVCALHANYLFLNKYSFETSIHLTHAEDPALPGYTKEGAEAARRVVMTFSGDMMESVTAQLWSMLHRGAFLGTGEDGVGIALRLGSQVEGVPGYTVFWGNRPKIGASSLPILFPAPGARGSATFCAREAPAVESDPSFYDTQRGLAVSVTYGDAPLSKIRLSLFRDDKKKPVPVPGTLFSHEKPVSKSFDPTNDRTAFFVADSMLEKSTWYTAVFEAAVEGSEQPLELVWSFETQK